MTIKKAKIDSPNKKCIIFKNNKNVTFVVRERDISETKDQMTQL